MLHFHHKLPAGGAALLLAFLLHGCAVRAASLPRHWLRGGGSEGQPAAFPPSSDMIKALEYIENLKQRNGGRPEPVDYDEVEKFKVLLQLASRQDEVPGERQAAPSIQRPDVTAEQLLKAMLKTLQDQGGREGGFPAAAASEPRSDRRTHRHRAKEMPGSAPVDYGNFPRPHKKYPLMFEDEENTDASKRATEDLDEQYTPQSLANLRSIFDELGRMPSMPGQKRGVFGGDEEEKEDGGNRFGQRNQAYEDVAGGEEWVPVEEREETEEVVNRSHEEMDRALGDQEEESEREETRRRADQNQEDADDDTKLVDYYLLKVLEMSDQTQKRDQTGEQKKRLIRPSIVDPRTVKELLELSLKLHVPPQDLIDMLLTEELRKLHRDPQALTRYTAAGQTPKIRYFSRRLPLKAKPPTDDMDREDFLDIIGVETISNEYPVVQRPVKTLPPADRIQAASSPAVGGAGPVKIPPPSGRRENLFLSELNKMPLKRQSDAGAPDDNDDDGDIEDEVTTYLAAKILTEYPNTVSKRDTRAQLKGQFPYELYERAVKDYMGQADTETRPGVKRDLEGPAEEKVAPTEGQEEEEEVPAKTSAPQTAAGGGGGEEEHREKKAAGM